jgi:hypothetical protein
MFYAMILLFEEHVKTQDYEFPPQIWKNFCLGAKRKYSCKYYSYFVYENVHVHTYIHRVLPLTFQCILISLIIFSFSHVWSPSLYTPVSVKPHFVHFQKWPLMLAFFWSCFNQWPIIRLVIYTKVTAQLIQIIVTDEDDCLLGCCTM